MCQFSLHKGFSESVPGKLQAEPGISRFGNKKSFPRMIETSKEASLKGLLFAKYEKILALK